MTTSITKTSAGYIVTIKNARGQVVVKQVYAELPVSSKIADLAAFAARRFGGK